MFFVCRGCGAWSAERPVVDDAVRCECGHGRPIARRPLFVLTGASGAGKSTVGDELLGRIDDPVVLDADILWAPEMDTPDDGYARLRSTWLRIVANVAQSGRSSLLVGAGDPEQYESRPERRYVGDIHWLALVCDDHVLEARLRARPRWRGVNDDFIAANRGFNAALRSRPDMRIVDTTTEAPVATAATVRRWIREALPDPAVHVVVTPPP